MLILSKLCWSLGCRYFSIHLNFFPCFLFYISFANLKNVIIPEFLTCNVVMSFLCQLIEPYGTGSIPVQSDRAELKYNLKLQGSSEKVGSGMRTSSLRSMSPDYDTKEIKNIYMDCKFFLQCSFCFLPAESRIKLLEV